jgi:hypothetical protein
LEEKRMEHHHYIVNGYMREETDGRLMNVASLEVFALEEQEALEKAAKLVEKAFYRVVSVITHDDKICSKGR